MGSPLSLPDLLAHLSQLEQNVPTVHARLRDITRGLVGIRIDGLSKSVLQRVIAYCEHHAGDAEVVDTPGADL
jgi:hypothetical protein